MDRWKRRDRTDAHKGRDGPALVELPAVSRRGRKAFTLVELPAVSRRGRKAFTLVELLVVVGIISLLVTILMPSLGRVREFARRAICATNLDGLGTAWQMYFADNNFTFPGVLDDDGSRPANTSQYSYPIYWRNVNDWVGPGLLWEVKLVSSPDIYVCPTIKANVGGVWYSDDLDGGWSGRYVNNWPPQNNGSSTTITYGTRRNLNYDDPNLSYTSSAGADAVYICKQGIADVVKPADFSFMADNFHMPYAALLSHVPGINVLYLDSHVEYWLDPTWNDGAGTGEVLYDNGITGWGVSYNYKHDDIWMIIDGYHQPPVGQGS
ncbi:hypothetical protein LCGC14_1230330 [marine sediment metagenome]|uniref:Type II secretion system protein GspG C-terminal domain-containing protein n=1 Tax=marine sediment metagenome TaxID=412755 RepID=A0A0F9LCW2_9ZZZZ